MCCQTDKNGELQWDEGKLTHIQFYNTLYTPPQFCRGLKKLSDFGGSHDHL